MLRTNTINKRITYNEPQEYRVLAYTDFPAHDYRMLYRAEFGVRGAALCGDRTCMLLRAELGVRGATRSVYNVFGDDIRDYACKIYCIYAVPRMALSSGGKLMTTTMLSYTCVSEQAFREARHV